MPDKAKSDNTKSAGKTELKDKSAVDKPQELPDIIPKMETSVRKSTEKERPKEKKGSSSRASKKRTQRESNNHHRDFSQLIKISQSKNLLQIQTISFQKRKSRSKSSERKSHKSRTRSKRSKSKSPKKKRSRSRSQGRRKKSRTPDRSRRSKSRKRSRSRSRRRSRSGSRWRRGFGSLSQRDRWKREPSRSPVLILRKKRSTSRTRRSTSKTPPRLTELDKDQLLEIAKANAAAMCAKAGVPIPDSLRPRAILQLPLPNANSR
ncbi:protein SON-like, partial [Danio aesculapii]|uniref:protein SON-like n=1 Tax=Danio aesculapii TaxID=1142201 RepID=UPI0024C04948